MFLNFFTLFLNNILVSVYIGCFCNEIDDKHLDSGAKLNELFKNSMQNYYGHLCSRCVTERCSFYDMF